MYANMGSCKTYIHESCRIPIWYYPTRAWPFGTKGSLELSRSHSGLFIQPPRMHFFRSIQWFLVQASWAHLVTAWIVGTSSAPSAISLFTLESDNAWHALAEELEGSSTLSSKPRTYIVPSTRKTPKHGTHCAGSHVLFRVCWTIW